MLGSSVTESSEKMLGLSVKMVSAQCCRFGHDGANSALTVTVFDGAAFDSDGAAFGGDGGVWRWRCGVDGAPFNGDGVVLTVTAAFDVDGAALDGDGAAPDGGLYVFE
ncbi:hypothetical protein Bca4012_049253 [Brassica carinata]